MRFSRGAPLFLVMFSLVMFEGIFRVQNPHPNPFPLVAKSAKVLGPALANFNFWERFWALQTPKFLGRGIWHG